MRVGVIEWEMRVAKERGDNTSRRCWVSHDGGRRGNRRMSRQGVEVWVSGARRTVELNDSQQSYGRPR